jgi:hypothetical protein
MSSLIDLGGSCELFLEWLGSVIWALGGLHVLVDFGYSYVSYHEYVFPFDDCSEPFLSMSLLDEYLVKLVV